MLSVNAFPLYTFPFKPYNDMKSKLLAGAAALLLPAFFFSCKNSGNVKPSATGARFELLIVMDDDLWHAPAGQAVFNLFDQDTPGLPQSEPLFKITHVKQADFSDLLKPSRNVLYVDVAADRYTQAKIAYAENYYSYPQCFVRITAPSDSALYDAITTHGDDVAERFIVAERERAMMFNKQDRNEKAVKEVEEHFGIQVDIPIDLKLSTVRDNFYWITNNSGYIRQDLVIYTYPYTDPNTFTYEYLTAKRDSVMRANIPGEVEGSYMGTEYRYYPPETEEITVNGAWCAETRGLWRMVDGEIMGGPFVSHTRIDEVNGRIIVAEGFVFAPRVDKRTPLRQVEAMVYTLKLPQEINAVTVVAKRPEVKDSAE